MRAEIISIGDELTSGQRLDTNSQWLSQRLGDLGVRVLYHTTVADDLDANIEAFRHAAGRADVVVATGGLGPTADDLTREALAAAAGVELILDEASLRHIENLFAARKRAMPERNKVQAMFPAGSRPIFNPDGTAPGIALDIPRPNEPLRPTARIFALPGVPAEMRAMWEQTVAGEIAALVGGKRVICHRAIRCFGVGESDLEAMLPDLIRRGRVPQVGITVSGATITLRITAEGETAADAQAAMESTVRTIYDCLGNLIFGEGEDELEHAVARLLTARGQTLATAECGTGGLIAHWFGELPAELAGCYRGGLVQRVIAASDGSRDRGAAVRSLTLDCLQRIPADHVLAVGDFPAPGGAPIQKSQPPADFFYAVASAGDPPRVVLKSSHFVGHPTLLKIRSAKQALNLLRLELLRNEREAHVRRD